MSLADMDRMTCSHRPAMGVGRILLILAALAAIHGADGVPITIVNYSELPVYAHAVALDHEAICKRLGVPAATPIAVRSQDHKEQGTVLGGTQDGKAVAWIILAMKPRSRLDLVAEAAQRWSDPAILVTAQATPGEMAGTLGNGVVRMTLGREGWSLAFAPPSGSGIAPMRAADAPPVEAHHRPGPADPFTMIHKGGLEFWVDNQNRGRLANQKPGDLGLIAFPAAATLVSCTAAVSAQGAPSLTLVRRLGGFAKDVTVTETFTLLPGLPILTCRMHWDNHGADPLWVAYVSSGNGIKGSWGPTLMDDPLIERMKTPLKGYLGGAETRPSWNGGLAKVSMESGATGCGVGLSTLLPTPGKVGTGSMIWGVNRSGFQVNLIDPVVGQFPFPLAARGTLDNGNAFLLTQNSTSVYRQTCSMWEALAAGRTPRLASPCAVFVDGQPVQHQTITDAKDILPLLQRDGDTLSAAVRLDANRHYAVTGRATKAVEVVVHLQDAKGRAREVAVGTTAAGTAFSLGLDAALTGGDEVSCIIACRNAVGALTALSIAETLTAAPEPWSPLDGASITDIATMFRWRAIPLVVDYELELSRTADFAVPVAIRIPMSKDQPWYIPPKEKLPEPGLWHWRVRGIQGTVSGAWSPVRTFTVERTLAKAPLIRPVSADQPLFTLEASRWRPYTAFTADIPEDLRPGVAIIVEGFVSEGLTIDAATRGLERLPHPFLMRTHPPTQISLADIEWVCQRFPNFIGIQGGETIKKLYEVADAATGDGDYHRRMVMLLAKYGRFFHEADGTYKDDAWQDLWDRQGAFLKEYGGYMVFSQKNNIIRRQFYTQSAVMGLWLGGITLAHGAWEDGGFYWQNAGFDGLGVCKGERSGLLRTMPRIFWTLMCVQGIARGCSIYSFDGQTLMYGIKEAARSPTGPWKPALWNDQYQTSDTWKRFVAPLIRATRDHHLVPGKAAVLANIRLAVYNDRTVQPDAVAWPYYLEYGPLFAATYGFKRMGGIDGQLWEFVQNTGRYHFIPVLPQGDVPLAAGIANRPVSQLQDVAAVKAIFDAAYPAWYEGDAFVERVGSTIAVLNGHENTDEAQGFAVPLGLDPVTSFAGRVQVHSYIVAKCEDQGRRFWLQANTEYPERPTELSFTCTRKPACTITPAAAGTVAWDAATSTLSLKLSHQDGAVEVELR